MGKAKQEMVHVEGVSEAVPKYFSGQLAIWFCNYCQTQPEVHEGEVAVSVGHDACVAGAGKKLLALGDELVFNTGIDLSLAEAQLRVALKRYRSNNSKLKDQHRVAETKETVVFFDGFLICTAE